MRYARVTTYLLDLWVKPRFESGRASQLFFGEALKVEKEQKGLCRVRQADGYMGWADSRFLMPVNQTAYKGLGGPPFRWVVIAHRRVAAIPNRD